MNVSTAELNTLYKIKSLDFVNQMLAHRLNALGFTEGAVVKVCNKKLFKGPCTLEVNGQHICIRNCDACCIKLEQCDA